MKGVYTAIVTPFKDSGELDFNALEKILDNQLKGGVSGIVIAGTSGEGATLTLDEKRLLFEFVKEKCPNLDLVAGTGTNNTAETVRQTEIALKTGVEKVLVVVPYYNKPTPRGLFLHYDEIAKTGAKIVLYNVPGRTGLNILPETLASISQIENVIAVKEASGDLSRFVDYLDMVGRERFDFLSGDDFTVVPFISLGGKGVVSVFTNIFPQIGVKMVDAALANDFEKAAKIETAINKLNHSMFIESNPIPVKTALSLMNYCKDNFRLPLAKMEKSNLEKLAGVIDLFNKKCVPQIEKL